MKTKMGTVLFRTVVLSCSSISSDPWSSFGLESSGRAGLYHNVWLTTYQGMCAFITIFILMVRKEILFIRFAVFWCVKFIRAAGGSIVVVFFTLN